MKIFGGKCNGQFGINIERDCDHISLAKFTGMTSHTVDPTTKTLAIQLLEQKVPWVEVRRQTGLGLRVLQLVKIEERNKKKEVEPPTPVSPPAPGSLPTPVSPPTPFKEPAPVSPP